MSQMREVALHVCYQAGVGVDAEYGIVSNWPIKCIHSFGNLTKLADCGESLTDGYVPRL